MSKNNGFILHDYFTLLLTDINRSDIASEIIDLLTDTDIKIRSINQCHENFDIGIKGKALFL